MPSWVIAGTLARSQRPGYGGERGQAVPPDAVATWLAGVKAMDQALPKPVLVHCSAGIDRTGQAIEHIRRRLGTSTDAS